MAEQTKPDHFYIGWQEQAPAPVAQAQRRFVALVAAGLLLLGLAFGKGQQRLSNGQFDFGAPTTVEGVLKLQPYPHLLIRYDATPNQAFFQQILLVGFGKFGALPTLEQVSKEKGIDLDSRRVKINGSLIYSEGKTLMELSAGPASILEIGEPEDTDIAPISLGPQQLQGEILDAKCYFGVMNPGEGKPHRSCAARCISGGVPPTLRIYTTGDLSPIFFLLVGPDAQPLHQQLLQEVGKPVSLCGEVKQLGDWHLMEVDLERGIQALDPWQEPIPMCYN